MPAKRTRSLRYEPTPDGYRTWKKQPGHRFSDATEKKYLPEIERYVEYAATHHVPLDEQDATFIEMEYFAAADGAFEATLGRAPSASYVRNRHIALKSYFDFLTRLGATARNPIDIVFRPTAEVGEIDWLTEDEDTALADVDMEPLEEILWALARLAGLRVSEIKSLNDGDVDVAVGKVRVRGGKTRAARREVAMVPRLVTAVERWRRYRAERHPATEAGDPFVRTRKGGISTTYIDVILKQVAARAGVRLHGRDENGDPIAITKDGKNVSKLSAHALRRTFGSDFLNRGVPIEVVSAQLGHANTKVTADYYARLTDKTQHDAILRSVNGGVASTEAALRGVRQKIDHLTSDLTSGACDRQLREIEALEAALARCRSMLLAA